MIDVSRRLARGARAKTVTMFAVTALVATLVALYATGQQSTAWVQHSRQVARLGRTALTMATDEETGIRGYLLARDSTMLSTYTNARRRLPALFASLLTTEDDPAQRERYRDIRDRLIDWNRRIAEPVLAAPERFDDPSARRAWAADGRHRFDAVRVGFQALINEEDGEYEKRVERDSLIRLWGMMLLLIEILVITVAATLADRRMIAQANEILDNNSRLEEQAVELEITMDESQLSAREREEAFAVLDAALGSAPQAFAFFDNDGQLVHRNGAFDYLLSGLESPPSGTDGAPAPAVSGAVQDAIDAVGRDRQPRSGITLESHHPDEHAVASRRTWTASYYPVEVAGRPLGVGMLASDATAYLRLESELRQSQKMDAIGQLAGSVAHDFNNVLTVITSYGDMLLMDMAPSPERRDVERIVQAANRAAALTKQLLTFSRKETLQPEPLDVNAVITGLEDMLRRLIGEEIQVVVHADGRLPEVVIDQGQLEQVLVNLAVNARDAMPGGGTLLIETSGARVALEDEPMHPGLKAGAYAVIAVSDTGVGIDIANQTRVFEPYFTTKAKGQGTGIGLATVYGVVRQAGGHIALYSEPGEGTTFRIWLPLADAGARTHTPFPGATKAVTRPSNLTVLVADDDDSVREAVVRVLQRRGYEVITARNGAEALALCSDLAARRQGIDLVISDVIMPEMSGPALIEQVRQVMGDVRVLFMSGYTGTHLANANLPPGMTAFIEKPFTVDVLLDKVAQVFDAEPVEVRLWAPGSDDGPGALPGTRAAREMARRAVELERRAAATLQRTLEARHRAVLDAMQEGVVLVDASGMVQVSNPSANEAMGGAHDITGQHLNDLPVLLVDESGAPIGEHDHPVHAALRTGEAQTWVFGTSATAGEPPTRWWLGYARALHSPETRTPYGAVWSFGDITARKHAEEALEKQTRFMHAVLDNLAEGVIACDADGRLSLVNDAAWVITGVTRSDVPMQEWARHFNLRHIDGTPYDSDDLPLARALRGEVVRCADVVIARPDGERVTVVSSARPLRAAGRDEILGAVVALQDVTAQRRVEEALRAAIDTALARSESGT